MTQEHPITPPNKLIHQWIMEATEPSYVPTQAARWGADQELDACYQEVQKVYGVGSWLRSLRRPKPPSLKEQAQVELDRLIALIPAEGALAMAEPIRRALEALPND